MRAFVALELPERFSYETAALARQLSAVVEGRFMRPESYHLTLAFLGDIGSGELAAATDALDSACAGTRPVALSCQKLGKFGKPHDATLWLGLARSEKLMRLAADVRDGLDARGVPFDDKPFKPHITLARRARIPRGALPVLAFPQSDWACFVTLFKSELSRDGATYKPLHTVELGA